MFGLFGGKKNLGSMECTLPRDALIQAGRILFVDDEVPLLVGELSKVGFALDHDRTGDEFEKQVAGQIYDVVVLDYFGVGHRYGDGQGLDLLRHIRRISPRTRIIAYTSRSLGSDESDFYRLADQVLGKDAGLRASLQIVEDELRRSLSKEHLFNALMERLQLSSSADRREIEQVLIKSLARNDQSSFRKALTKTAGQMAEKGVDILLAKLFIDA